MSRFKGAVLAVLLSLLLAGTGGCAPKSSEESAPSLEAGGTVEVTDMLGRKVRLAVPPQKVVALTASCCEILCALEAGDTLVGRGEFCDYPPEILEAPLMQSGEQANMEQIIGQQPQLVLMGAMAQTQQQIQALEQAGIPVVVTDAQNIQEVYDSIRLVGAVLGRDDKAEALVSEMEESFARIARQVPPQTEKKTVYFEVSPLEHGLWTAGSGTFMTEIAQMLGLVNAFEDVEGWAQISQEQVLERNPDYMVTVTMYYGEGPEPQEEIYARSGWQELDAVKNKQVFPADSDEITRPGPRLVTAAELLYQSIYGDSQAA